MSKCLRMSIYEKQKFEKFSQQKQDDIKVLIIIIGFKLDLAPAQYISIFEKK